MLTASAPPPPPPPEPCRATTLTVRVTVTGLFVVTDHPTLATGAPHTLLGLIVLGLALGLFSLTSYVLNHLFVDAPDEDEPPDAPEATASGVV